MFLTSHLDLCLYYLHKCSNIVYVLRPDEIFTSFIKQTIYVKAILKYVNNTCKHVFIVDV